MDLAPHPSQPPTRLRLSSPGEVLAAVPYLIGFAPQRSVVVLSLREKQVGLTMRLDLDTPAEDLLPIVVSRLRADGADTAVLILFDPDEGVAGRRPGARLARGLIRAVRAEKIAVQDALGVREGFFWSYLCRQLSCCPPGGRPLPVAGSSDHSKVASTFVAIGSAPMASREEVSASIAGPDEEARHDLTPWYALALEKPMAYPVERWAVAVARYADAPPRPGGELMPAEATRLIVSLQDVHVRDEVISWTAGESLEAVLAVLRELATLAAPPFQVQVLATLAWAAYSFGDGALAAIAIERALADDPGHALAQLLATCLDSGIAPPQLRAISAELSAMVSDGGWPNQDAR